MIEPRALQQMAARCLPGRSKVVVEAVGHGGTTPVYRATRGQQRVFIRLAESAGESMAVEAALHQELRQRGISVPAVISVEPQQDGIDRGALVIAEVPGVALKDAAGDAIAIDRIAFDLGRDLGRMSHVQIDGFGFVSSTVPAFRGELRSVQELLLEPAVRGLEGSAGTLADSLTGDLRDAIEVAEHHLSDTPSVLCHGDMDSTHVYVADGSYAGIIDLGEAQGAPPLLDVACWAVHQQQLPVETLPAVIGGYAETAALPPYASRHIGLLGSLIALKLLDRVNGRGQVAYEAVLRGALPSVVRMALE